MGPRMDKGGLREDKIWRDRPEWGGGRKPWGLLDMAVSAKLPQTICRGGISTTHTTAHGPRPLFTMPLVMAIIYGAQLSQQSANQVLQGHSAGGGDGDDDDDDDD
ncbi:hypothetical protein EMPG_16860 [Blastomyces silverae]|uniref:Uncharacterized protein n=1 Tax=Blastomyces silverae TaxID=2060906 RepID=A0A0H1B8E1_9EURO|nr:hypothetical protein EMPG_16860 [Blastomyces silverae]